MFKLYFKDISLNIEKLISEHTFLLFKSAIVPYCTLTKVYSICLNEYNFYSIISFVSTKFITLSTADPCDCLSTNHILISILKGQKKNRALIFKKKCQNDEAKAVISVRVPRVIDSSKFLN